MGKYSTKLFASLFLVVGFVLGVLIMGLLSQKASKTYLEIVNVKYEIQQEKLASRAKKDGDLERALIHYTNLVDATSSPGRAFFNFDETTWTWGFPFAALFLHKISEGTDSQGIARARNEGVNRGKLAAILEALGREKEASEQYKKAAALIGFEDINRVKKLITTLESEEERARTESKRDLGR